MHDCCWRTTLCPVSRNPLFSQAHPVVHLCHVEYHGHFLYDENDLDQFGSCDNHRLDQYHCGDAADVIPLETGSYFDGYDSFRGLYYYDYHYRHYHHHDGSRFSHPPHMMEIWTASFGHDDHGPIPNRNHTEKTHDASGGYWKSNDDGLFPTHRCYY